MKKRWLPIVTIGLILWGLFAAFRGRAGLPPIPAGGGGSDLLMYAAVAKRVAVGEDYYRVLADELPARGYAIRPIFNWRLPTLTWLNAIPPAPVVGRSLFTALCALVVVAGVAAVRRSVPRLATAALPVLLLSTAPLVMMRSAWLFHEIWAGWLMLLSLFLWALGRWKLSIIAGIAALAVRELALPFVLIMAGIAWWEGRRKEAFVWGTSVALFLMLWVWHVAIVLAVMPAEGLRNSWVMTGGWAFVLSAAHATLFLMLLPEAWSAAIIVPLVWAGAWLWEDGLGRRIAVVLTGYFGLFMLIGRPDNWYWGFLIAPLITIGGFGYFFGPKRKRTR